MQDAVHKPVVVMDNFEHLISWLVVFLRMMGMIVPFVNKVFSELTI